MKATRWEFANRALVIGLIFGVTFPLYALDPQNATAWLAQQLAGKLHVDADQLAQSLFVLGTLFLLAAALVRTWASAYLNAGVVYSAALKTETLVADGPYRWVRNPLYFGNLLMSVGLGCMMSRLGFSLAVLLMLVFCLRLIFREEEELQASQGASYARYTAAVPRLLPAFTPRIASSAKQAKWSAGFKAELWCWGFAAAVSSFAITLKQQYFFIVLGLSLLLFWVSSSLLVKNARAESSSQGRTL